MSWLTEWKAIAAQIQGLLEAASFYSGSATTIGHEPKDVFAVGNKQLIPHIHKIRALLSKFSDNYKDSIPRDAADSLADFFNKYPTWPTSDDFGYVHIMVTVLVSFRAQFEYHISDTSFVAKRLSERAFIHLQRSIVADEELRNKWIKAFNKGKEPACEKLGGAHLLLHGIWAFKVNTAGERTDLVFNEPILDFSSVERTAEALVLTEWKRVLSPSQTEAMAGKVREQAARYTVGALGGVELAGYRFIVLVSKEHLTLPEDRSENGVRYQHINIAVDPNSPSKS
jgi:hypothetical protein